MDKPMLMRSVRAALLGVGTMGAMLPVGAAEDAGDTELAEVVVTGTRVRGAAPVGSTVLTLDRDALDGAGQPTVDRIIKELPLNFDLGVSENSRAQSGGSGNIVYGNTVNLRGIGPYATLVLLDGHRVTNNTRSTDPSIIPTLGLERVEVVADGASAIYGSDAVAGVVNLIPRRSLDGTEVFGRFGAATQGGFSEWVTGAAWGKVWDRGQFMLAYEHVDRQNLSGDDRDFFVSDQRPFGGNDSRTTRCSPGTIVAGNTTYAIPAGGVTQANAAALVAGTANRCDDLQGQDLFPRQKYDSLSTTFRYEITPAISLFGDGYYSYRRFHRAAAFGNARLAVPETNAFFVRPDGFVGTSYFVDYNFSHDLPSNDSFGQARNWQFTPGLRFQLPGEWQLEALVGAGRTEDDSNTWSGVGNPALTAALNSSDPATAFDPYGLNRTSDAVKAAIANQIFLAPTNSDFRGYEARLNGNIMNLPGGGLALAAGLERQEITVDLGSARGGPATPMSWRTFDREVDSAYAELQVPLFGAGNARPGFNALTLVAAIRHDDYSDMGETTNEKFGVTWKPAPGVSLRGSYGTSFRAPLISQIYGNSNNLFVQNYTNPAGGPALPGAALSGQNLDLGPETATTWTTGIDWDATDALRLGLTYFDVEYRNQVESYLSNLNILGREADFAGTGIILRGADAAARAQELIDAGIVVVNPLPGGSAANIQVFVDGRSQNLGVSHMKGFDIDARYALRSTPVGDFQFSLTGTWMTDFDVAITAVAAPVDRLNTIFNPLKLKLRSAAAWSNGPYQATLSVTRVGGYQNIVVTPAERVKPYTPVDLTFGMDLGGMGMTGPGENLSVGLELRNVFDEDPPYVNLAPGVNGSGGYDATSSNPIGRLLALSLRKKW